MPAVAFNRPGPARSAGRPAPLIRAALTEPPARFPTATTLYVRKTGSDNNGGDSTGTSPSFTGGDGVLDGTTYFTAASGAFDASYVDRPINIVGVGRFRIEAAPSATELTLSVPVGASNAGSGKTWNIGGAVQTARALLANQNDAVREGDTIYMGAGVYRETLDLWVSPKHGAKNGTAPISIIGDVEGTHTGDAGMVQITGYTTDDNTAPSPAALLRFTNNSFLSFSSIFFVHSGAAGIDSSPGRDVLPGAASQFIRFTDCAFFFSRTVNAILIVSTPAGLNWAFDRSRFFLTTNGTGILIRLATLAGGGADYDAAYSFVNCFMPISTAVPAANPAFQVQSAEFRTTGARGGGGVIRNCTLLGGVFASTGGGQPGAQLSVLFPLVVDNSLIISAATALACGTQGYMTEDYNIINATTPRGSNAVPTGAHSFGDGSYAPLIHFGQELQWGALLRPFGEPMAGSPVLGFGGDGSQTAYDLRNFPRPAGGGNALAAVGAMDRANTFAKETGTVHSGTTAISAIGPAYHDFLVAVASGTSYTFSIYSYFDTTYTGTAPQLKLLQGAEAGVSDQSVTAVTLPSYNVSSSSNSTDLNNAATIVAESFTPTTDITVSAIGLILNKFNSPIDNVTVELRATSSGHPAATSLGSGTVVASGLPTLLDPATFTTVTLATPVTLTAGTTYWICVRRSGADDGTNYATLLAQNAAGWSGDYAASNNSGGSWTINSPAWDNPFILYGWAKITLSPFAPTSDGFVTVRVQSNDTSGTSEVVFDTFSAT